MRILVEPSAHGIVNVGDTAMLEVAVRRLQELWPAASIGVITEVPDRLASHCPGAIPVSAAGRHLWFDQPYLGPLHVWLRPGAAARLRRAEEGARRRWPSLVGRTIRLRRRLRGQGTKELAEFLDWVTSADLIVASGAGVLADPYAPRAITVLELLESARERGARAAMLGHGIGPITDPRLLGVARRVLPKLDLVGLREERSGRPILRALGVDEDRVVTTGDDAIEVAIGDRDAEPAGTGIGVNVRVARYSGLDDDRLEAVGLALRRAAARRGAELIPLPISFYRKEQDAAHIARVLGRDRVEVGELRTPAAVLERIRGCRIVVSGSYHGGVFALAQGIPAIGLVGSEYYEQKFAGLADQFHAPYVSFPLDQSRLVERLGAALDDAWHSAPERAPGLLQAAEQQLEKGRNAYRRLRDLVSAS